MSLEKYRWIADDGGAGRDIANHVRGHAVQCPRPDAQIVHDAGGAAHVAVLPERHAPRGSTSPSTTDAIRTLPATIPVSSV